MLMSLDKTHAEANVFKVYETYNNSFVMIFITSATPVFKNLAGGK